MQCLPVVVASVLMCLIINPAHADEVSLERRPAGTDSLLATIQQNCSQCHGKHDKLQGDVNLFKLKTVAELTANPELLGELIDVLDTGFMPPEDAPPLADQTRANMLIRLRELLREAVALQTSRPRTPLRRMNRFQYNNAVQDLFALNVVVFPLPERMLREHGNYFQPQSGKMPNRLKAGSRPLGKSQMIERRLAGVTPFPQDLRAEHGFDNRGDHLTLSPLLLESLLKLSQSIVDSPDFNAKTCGIWHEFFAPPVEPTGEPGSVATDQTAHLEAIIRARLRTFLTRAFRRPVDDQRLTRYTEFVLAQIRAGGSFSAGMKSAAAAAIASPHFFYLYDLATTEAAATAEPIDDFCLASRLSFFLWGSLPDQTLLDLAAEGTLHEPSVLSAQVDRMLHDEKLKRFCDSFPAQWLQLERIISSTPDPEKYPQFYFSKYRVSMHMMLEPLLLFEAVLIEDRSVLNFIDSDFSYRSGSLEAWYRDGSRGNVGPPTIIEFRRVPVTDRRQGGLITNAAVMTMTSNATRTQPITRGAWVAGVILNDPPQPPPADVRPLADEPAADQKNLTLRERFALHRTRADCAGCHKRIDPLGFALENYDPAGLWRDKYENGRDVDAGGTLFGRHKFANIIEFKDALLAEKDRFTRAFAAHLLSFGLGRKIGVADSLVLDEIVRKTAAADYRFQVLIKQVVLRSFVY